MANNDINTSVAKDFLKQYLTDMFNGNTSKYTNKVLLRECVIHHPNDDVKNNMEVI